MSPDRTNESQASTSPCRVERSKHFTSTEMQKAGGKEGRLPGAEPFCWRPGSPGNKDSHLLSPQPQLWSALLGLQPKLEDREASWCGRTGQPLGKQQAGERWDGEGGVMVQSSLLRAFPGDWRGSVWMTTRGEQGVWRPRGFSVQYKKNQEL